MSFHHDHPGRRTSGGRRTGKACLFLSLTAVDRARLDAHWIQIPAATMGLFVSAAILWFGSLERESQTQRVWVQMSISEKKCKSRSVWVVDWVGDFYRSWHWPISTTTQVLNAAVLGFLELGRSTQEPWLLETLTPCHEKAAYS